MLTSLAANRYRDQKLSVELLKRWRTGLFVFGGRHRPPPPLDYGRGVVHGATHSLSTNSYRDQKFSAEQLKHN